MTAYPDFGPYRLEALLGRGGMGEVFRAHDVQHERTVAIKRLAPHLADDQEFQQRFQREARHVARLANPHVIPIHTYGEIDGQLFIDMRFVDGLDLHDLIRRSAPLAPTRSVAILGQLASALDAAHAVGLVHRDVKPSNVLIDGTVADFCYLADFGITRLATTQRSHSLTRTGALLGSLDYMAPEQFDGAITRQSDIYALTCVFFEMLTGAKPYAGEGIAALMHSHLKIPPPLPSARNPAAAMFDEIVARGMTKVPEDRFATAGELAMAAQEAIAERDRPTVPPSTAGRPVQPLPVLPLEHPAAPVRLAGSPAAERTAEDEAATEPEAGREQAAAAAIQEPDSTADGAAVPAPTGPRRQAPLLVAAVAVVVVLLVGFLVGANSQRDSNAGQPLPTAGQPEPAAPPLPPAAVGPVLREAIFTGRSSGSEITLAVGIKDGRAVGYLCDGSTVEAWLEGNIAAERLELHGRDPATVVSGTVDQRSVLGTLTVKGRTLPFSAQIAVSDAGLYESRRTVDGIGSRIGWIVLADGSQVGIKKTGDRVTPAPPLDPATLTAEDGGAPIQAVAVTGATPIFG